MKIEEVDPISSYIDIVPAEGLAVLELKGGFNNRIAVLSKPDGTKLIAKLMGKFTPVDHVTGTP